MKYSRDCWVSLLSHIVTYVPLIYLPLCIATTFTTTYCLGFPNYKILNSQKWYCRFWSKVKNF